MSISYLPLIASKYSAVASQFFKWSRLMGGELLPNYSNIQLPHQAWWCLLCTLWEYLPLLALASAQSTVYVPDMSPPWYWWLSVGQVVQVLQLQNVHMLYSQEQSTFPTISGAFLHRNNSTKIISKTNVGMVVSMQTPLLVTYFWMYIVN